MCVQWLLINAFLVFVCILFALFKINRSCFLTGILIGAI